jgi:hypothetical protein
MRGNTSSGQWSKYRGSHSLSDDAAWNWAVAMSREERSSRFGEVVKANRK